MRKLDLICLLTVLTTGVLAARTVFAEYQDCKGYASDCAYSSTPVPGEGDTCSKAPMPNGPKQYRAAGTGAFLYIEDTTKQCGDTASVRVVGGSRICDSLISSSDCGGNQAINSCKTPAP